MIENEIQKKATNHTSGIRPDFRYDYKIGVAVSSLGFHCRAISIVVDVAQLMEEETR